MRSSIQVALTVLPLLALFPAQVRAVECEEAEPPAIEEVSRAAAESWLDRVAEAFGGGSRIDLRKAKELAREAPEGEDARAVASSFRWAGESAAPAVPSVRAAMARMLGVDPARMPPALTALLDHAPPASNVPVDRYDLSFELCGRPARYPARALLTLSRPAEGESILEIDPERLTILAVTAEGASLSWKVEGGRLRIDAPGVRNIAIQYQLQPTEDPKSYGLIRTHGRLFSMTWPYHCGALFPCNSDPSAGSIFSIQAKVCGDKELVATGQRQGEAFVTAGPAPAYAAALYAASDFREEKTPASFAPAGVETFGAGRAVAEKTRDEYRARAADAVDFFSRWLGPYAFGDSLALVEVAAGGYGGIESVAAVALMRDSLLDRPTADETAVHEVAHHWFGDNLRIASWPDFWLSEGFADYLTYRYFRATEGERSFRHRLRLARDEAGSALQENPHALVPAPGTDINSVYDSVPYSMGAWMLRMMEVKAGTGKFDAMLARWYREHRFQPVGTEEFLDFASRETGVDFREWFAGWNALRAVPTFRGQVTLGGRRITASLETVHPAPPGTAIPLQLTGAGGERRVVQVEPGVPLRLDAGFVVTAARWDPEVTVLARVR